jgi:hypothetical protein
MTIHAGIIRDHSVSMRSIVNGAKKDYNSVIESLKGNAERIFVSCIECGRLNVMSSRAKVKVDFENIWVENLSPLENYIVDGQSTPLWDSVNTGINTLLRGAGPLKAATDTFILMTITDGGENSSVETNIYELKRRIAELQKTDRWTFVFRVPVGHKYSIAKLGIPEGNIIEWEQNETAFAAATMQQTSALRSYVSDVSRGVTSSRSFYDTSALSQVRPADLRRELDDITEKVRVESVWSEDEGQQIRDFCMKSFGEFTVGHAYYQLDKPEKVQASKKLIVKHKKKGRYYSGDDVRDTLGLPSGVEIKLKPADHPDYEVYVQSTSVNRKMTKKTKVVYI